MMEFIGPSCYLFVKCFSKKFSAGTVCFGAFQPLPQRILSQGSWKGFVFHWVGLTLSVNLGRSVILEFSKLSDGDCLFSCEKIGALMVELCKSIQGLFVCLSLLHFTTKSDGKSIVSPKNYQSSKRFSWKKCSCSNKCLQFAYAVSLLRIRVWNQLIIDSCAGWKEKVEYLCVFREVVSQIKH